MPVSLLEQFEMDPHGKHQLSNKKLSSKSVHPVDISEVTNIFEVNQPMIPFKC